MTRAKTAGLAALAVYVAGIVLANWAINRFGLVPVGFGLLAPAGVYFAAVTFPARDVVQRSLGRAPGLAAIVAGAAVSWWLSSPSAGGCRRPGLRSPPV